MTEKKKYKKEAWDELSKISGIPAKKLKKDLGPIQEKALKKKHGYVDIESRDIFVDPSDGVPKETALHELVHAKELQMGKPVGHNTVDPFNLMYEQEKRGGEAQLHPKEQQYFDFWSKHVKPGGSMEEFEETLADVRIRNEYPKGRRFGGPSNRYAEDHMDQRRVKVERKFWDRVKEAFSAKKK